MDYYVKPTLSKNPKEVIIHAGTNNIPRDEPGDIGSKTAKLGEYIERTSNAKVIISSIIIRSENLLNSKIEATNSLLYSVYKKNLNPFKFKLAITYCSNLTALIALN
jgi:hypothetical protein